MQIQAENATREIMWNVNTISNSIIMYGLLAVALIIGFGGIVSRGELYLSGQPDSERLGSFRQRFFDLVKFVLFQRKVVRKKNPAIFHTLIYTGFLVLLFTTTMVLIDHDLGIKIYQGRFYLAVTLLSDFFGIALLIGVLIATERRYIQKPDLIHTTWIDNIFLIGLAVLVVQGYVLEGIRISVTGDPWAKYSPVGYLTSLFFHPFPVIAQKYTHFLFWWFHTLTVFLFVAITPYTKLFHIFSSSANLFF